LADSFGACNVFHYLLALNSRIGVPHASMPCVLSGPDLSISFVQANTKTHRKARDRFLLHAFLLSDLPGAAILGRTGSLSIRLDHRIA
jgi:hypothetical protein